MAAKDYAAWLKRLAGHGHLFGREEVERVREAHRREAMRDARRERIEACVRGILHAVGEDPDREGLKETPSRVAKAYSELLAGYAMEERAGEILKTFSDDGCDEMVMVRGIPFYSMCEHHMLPFHGVAHIGYIPDGRILGLSKFARVTDVYARRLQVQEKLTGQIADAIVRHLRPKGVGVVMEAAHMCMAMRGVGRQGALTKTSALRGVIREDARARSEFLALCGRSHALLGNAEGGSGA